MSSPRPAGAARPLRKDAEENRNRILAAAREVFAERGLEASLHDVADRAGVGIGTVYRRFRNKDEVAKAVFEEQIEQVVAVAEEALGCADPWTGFEQLFLQMASQFSLDRGLREVILSGSAGVKRAGPPGNPLATVFGAVLKRGHQAGVLRAGLEPSDLPPIAQMLSAVIDYTRKVNPDVWHRYALFFLDGLRPQPDRHSARTMPSALTDDEVETLLGFRTGDGGEHDGRIAAPPKTPSNRD